MKVAMISFNDWGGAGWQTAEALRLCQGIDITHVVYHDNAWQKFHRDICVAVDSDCMVPVQRLLEDADIIHFWGDDPIPENLIWKWPQSEAAFEIPKGTKKVVTKTGSFFRQHSDKRISCIIASNKMMMQYTDFRCVATPDLNYNWFNCRYVPLCLNSSDKEFSWVKPSEKLRITHSPTVRDKKGTKLIVEAISEMDGVELDLIEKVEWAESVERKRSSHLFIDSLVGPSWGISSVEAMQFGIPVISNIFEDYVKECPILKCKESKDELKTVIKKFIDSDMISLAIRTKQFCDLFHSYEAVSTKYKDVYKSCLATNS